MHFDKTYKQDALKRRELLPREINKPQDICLETCLNLVTRFSIDFLNIRTTLFSMKYLNHKQPFFKDSTSSVGFNCHKEGTKSDATLYQQEEEKRKTRDTKKHQPPDSPFYCTHLYLLHSKSRHV